jgi:DNA modification methylase
MADESAQMCVTSPPYYGLRDYGIDGQIGLEQVPDEYVAKLVSVFREVKRVLKKDGTLWLNLGDSYATSSPNGSGYGEISKTAGVGNSQKGVQSRAGCFPGIKPKDLIGTPWMVAFALRNDGWYLRQDIIWAKPNPMPESVKDRCTKSHEQIFLLTKSQHYYYDAEAIAEPSNYPDDDYQTHHQNGGKRLPTEKISGFRPRETPAIYPTRNKRDVWIVNTQPFRDAHFATFPPKLIEPCILAGSKRGDVVLDPFNGAGTTGVVCKKYGRDYIGIDLNPDYITMSKKRVEQTQESMI